MPNYQTMDANKFYILCDEIKSKELKALLDNHFSNTPEIKLELEPEPDNIHSIDPTILAAFIGFGGVVLGMFVNTLIEVLKAKASFENSQITIKAKNGREVSFPLNTSKEKIKESLKLMETLELETLEIE